MKVRILIFIYFLSSSLICKSQNNSISYKGNELDLGTLKIAKLYKGKEKVFVDKQLDVRGIEKYVVEQSNQWTIEIIFFITQAEIYDHDIWLQLRTNINAAEVYLNNQLIFINGRVGENKNDEISGKNLIRKQIERKGFNVGKNLLSVKFSNFGNRDGAIFKDLSFGKLEVFQNQSQIMSIAPLFFFGVFLLAVFINVALFFSLNRKKVFVVLALLFLNNFLLMAYEVLYWNGFLLSSSVFHSLYLRSTLEYSIYLFLTQALILEYDFKRKFIYTGLVIFIILFITTLYINGSTAMFLSLLPLSFSTYALLKRKSNSLLLTITLTTLSVLIFLDHYDVIEDYEFVKSNFVVTSFFFKLDVIGMVIFAVVMIYTSAQKILLKTIQLNETKFKLERLEHQFLKKQIQPHFIINSLMSLQQLVSKDPKNASRMIDALSEEFYLINQLNKEKFIPIHKEIEMCENHLQIMGLQQKANYVLEVDGINGDEKVPPTILQTLIENGITHGYSGNENASFTLKKDDTDNVVRYTLFNDSKNQRSDKKGSGTGLKYVESRLEECFPGRWTLNSGSVEDGWEVVIEIKD